jgi:hypothetical protein
MPRKARPIAHYDCQAALDKADYIVLIYTAPMLHGLGSGFIEEAYKHYFPEGNKNYDNH